MLIFSTIESYEMQFFIHIASAELVHEVHTGTEGEAEEHDGFFDLGQAQRYFCPALH